MSNKIAVRNDQSSAPALAVQTPMEICRTSLYPSLSPANFNLFWAVALKKGLDPLANEIMATVRRVKNKDTGQWEERLVIQTGIDGYRHIAEDSGEYLGQDEPVFDREPESRKDLPRWCKVTVYRRIGEDRVAFTAKVFFHEFAQTFADGNLTQMWARMPWHMLAKCAEVQAIRKAFPRRTAGVQHDDEVAAEDTPQLSERVRPLAQAVAAIQAAERPAASGMAAEWNKAVMAFAEFDIDAETLLARLDIKTPAEFTRDHADQLQGWYGDLRNTVEQEETTQ